MKAFKGGDSLSQQKQWAGNHDVVDKALYKWFKNVREEGLQLHAERKNIKIYQRTRNWNF